MKTKRNRTVIYHNNIKLYLHYYMKNSNPLTRKIKEYIDDSWSNIKSTNVREILENIKNNNITSQYDDFSSKLWVGSMSNAMYNFNGVVDND